MDGGRTRLSTIEKAAFKLMYAKILSNDISSSPSCAILLARVVYMFWRVSPGIK
jgi:hypothetical protein